MKRRYILAPEAAGDLVQVWKYLKEESGRAAADRMESLLREKFVFLSKFPAAGHSRRDLTAADVRFFPVFSFLIVYRPETKPLQVVSILHGGRDVESILRKRV
jgi:toxin ParE1/3/4